MAPDHSSKSSSYLKQKADASDLSIFEKANTLPTVLITRKTFWADFLLAMIR
jgi:hypothetical protein